MRWAWPEGYTEQESAPHKVGRDRLWCQTQHPALPRLVGCDVTVPNPHLHNYEDVMAHNPDGVFLSNGPGDPAANPVFYAVPMIKEVLEKTELPVFGICLGPPDASARVGRSDGQDEPTATHGANHPVQRYRYGESRNYLDEPRVRRRCASLPSGVVENASIAV